MFFVFSLLIIPLTFLTTFFSHIPVATAQANLVAPTNALRISVVPEFPGPFENVVISVENFSTDLNKVNIIWSVNGKVVQSGIGLKRFNVKSGAFGSNTTVTVNMGGDIQDISIRPAAVDLLWQADTYTPPFYLAKALHSNQDPITVVAEPFFINNSGARLDPAKLIYKWKKNGTVSEGASGYGKKSFQVTTSVLLKPIEISVEVSSTDGNYQAANTIVVDDTQTETLLYENSPLYGILFNKELSGKDVALANSEVRILGVPLYFSNLQKNRNTLAFNWSLNNNAINQQGNEVIFRKPDGTGAGRSLVSLRTENKERFTQSSNTSTNITYNTKEQDISSQTVF